MKQFLKSERNLAVFTWVVLAFTILVILWGAFVRATGSGAGCGSHWPLCNGVAIPRDVAVETQIEFFHRITSALSGVFVLALLAWSFYVYPKGHVVRKGAVVSTFFVITEGLVGAGLVLFEMVAHNASTARVLWLAGHLVNTFLLLASLTLTAWWASGGRPLRWRGQGRTGWLLLGGALLLLGLGVTGAITALGDTLYPASSLAEGIQQDFLSTSHLAVRLRVWHPVIAIVTSIYLVAISAVIAREKATRQTHRLSRTLWVLILVQLAAGVSNIFLLAPVWLQIIHLLLADLVWVCAVLFGAAALAEKQSAAESSTGPVAAAAGD